MLLTRAGGPLLVVALVVGCSRSDPTEPLAFVWLSPGEFTGEERCLGPLDCVAEDRCFPQACVNGRCESLPPVSCEDDDPCTEDTCDPSTGACEFRPLSFDEDGDGFRAPRPGFDPGAPGSCGDDCDDTSPDAFPGGIERCDGVDNDCNGVVDEDAAYLPLPMTPVLVPAGAEQSSVGGLAYTGDLFAAGFAAQRGPWQNSLELLLPSGQTAFEERGITSVNADTFGGPLVWTGSQLAAAWEDRRDGDFEIYFNRFDAEGEKRGPDVRVTEAVGFSLRPSVVWTGAEFVVVWGDRRNDPDDYQIFGQRIGRDGRLIGENVELTPPGLDAEAPSLAQGSSGLGMTFNVASAGGRRVAFQALSTDLGVLGEIVEIGPPGSVAASLVWLGDRYVAAWSLRDVTPGPSIYATTLSEAGRTLEPPTAITGPAPFARSQSLLPLGDRLLVVWAEERGGSYDLFTKQVAADLTEISRPAQITSTPTDTTSPVIAFGPDGDVGILYEDLQSGAWQVYFRRLSCRPGQL